MRLSEIATLRELTPKGAHAKEQTLLSQWREASDEVTKKALFLAYQKIWRRRSGCNQ